MKWRNGIGRSGTSRTSCYWHGSREEYFKLYDYAVDGVRRALPNARVGGPEVAGGPGGNFLREFLEHCAQGTNYVTGKIGSPLDFISFHAKGSPSFANDHVRMGMASAVAEHERRLRRRRLISRIQKDAARHWRIRSRKLRRLHADPQEAYRNGTMYSSYTAASFPRALELADAARRESPGRADVGV